MVEMENEVLDARTVTRRDVLTDAKVRAVERLTSARGSLLDFGAGSGKYVYFCRKRFCHVEGVEITPTCIAFAERALGVALKPRLQRHSHFDVITAWHAIEHVPPEELRGILAQIHDMTDEAFIVCVPNSQSWASQWFGKLYPYYDANSHFHQFSPESLRRLLVDVGWDRISPFQSGIYSTFCYAQGLVNAVTGTHNLLYYRLKRGRVTDSLTRFGVCMHGALFMSFLPLALIITGLERLAAGKGACINLACYKRSTVPGVEK